MPARLSERLDVGSELFWVPSDTADGNVRTTHIDAMAQFRPWRSNGFFLKAGPALGDIQRADGLVPDMIGNFWSLGAAIVIR
jgi:hypothetical protein